MILVELSDMLILEQECGLYVTWTPMSRISHLGGHEGFRYLGFWPRLIISPEWKRTCAEPRHPKALQFWQPLQNRTGRKMAKNNRVCVAKYLVPCLQCIVLLFFSTIYSFHINNRKWPFWKENWKEPHFVWLFWLTNSNLAVIVRR